MLRTPDKNGQIDGTVQRILQGVRTDKTIVPLTLLNNFFFDESLYELKDWVLVDYCEYGANHWDRQETHFWGKNTQDFTYVPKTEEWAKFDKFVKDNPPSLILKRELLKKDVSEKVKPIDFPSFYIVPEPQTEEEYNKRPIEVFHYWGHSHELRRAFHGSVFEYSRKSGIGVVDNLNHLEKSLTEYKRLWVTVNVPHFARIPMEQILQVNSASKISVSLAGAGVKCFRHAEAPINSLMLMQNDNLAWSYEWQHKHSCLKSPIPYNMEQIRGLSESSMSIPYFIEDFMKQEDLYEIYRNGVENAKNYQLDNYIKKYLEPIINNQ